MQLKAPFLLLIGCLVCLPGQAAPRHEQFEERARNLVFIEFFIQREVDRQSGQGVGLVISDDGLVVCLPNVFPDWVPPDWIRSVKAYPAENPLGEGIDATYLGQDWVNGWHYLRVNDPDAVAAHLTPVTVHAPGEPRVGEAVWGICMTTGELDYIPYYREGRLSTIQPLPMRTAFVTAEVATPGGPVFLEDGRFAGWAGRSLPMERDMWIGSEFFRANIRNPDETHMFLLADEFLGEAFARIPADPLDHQRPWIGISGTQPLDKETARFMGLSGQGAIIISEVLPDSPADRAGLQDRDLVIAIRGEPIPRLKPDSVLQVYLERELLVSPIGEPLALTPSAHQKAQSGDEINREVHGWLLRARKPLAVYCPNDILANELSAFCRQLLLAVPRDVLILGADNDELLCLGCLPALSSIRLPYREVGRRATALLQQLLEGGAIPPEPLLIHEPDIVERQSTVFQHVNDPHVERALQWMRDHCAHGISVEDVARAAGVSLRSLEVRFQGTIGRTPRKELNRLRLESVKRLLREQNQTLEQIAENCSFSSGIYLSQFFRREAGMTPGEYRKTFRG